MGSANASLISGRLGRDGVSDKPEEFKRESVQGRVTMVTTPLDSWQRGTS